MSEHGAFAKVITMLRDELVKGLPRGVKVTTLPLKKAAQGHATKSGVSSVNVFLFLVEPNSSLRNQRPTPGSPPTSRVQPHYDLRFLITPFGSTDPNSPHNIFTLLERTISLLEEFPVLDLPGATPAPVRLVAESLSYEDMQRLWTVFGTPVHPSLFFRASGVPVTAVRRNEIQ